MTRKQIEIEIRRSLARLSDADVSKVQIDEDLSDAIALDSLGRLELLSDVEDRLDLTIYDVDSEKSSTIGGMLEIIEAALAENTEAA